MVGIVFIVYIVDQYASTISLEIVLPSTSSCGKYHHLSNFAFSQMRGEACVHMRRRVCESTQTSFPVQTLGAAIVNIRVRMHPCFESAQMA